MLFRSEPDPAVERLLGALAGAPRDAGAPRGAPPLQLLARKLHYAHTGELLCPDGHTVAGSALQTLFRRGGWQALDDAWAVGGFDNTAVVQGGLPVLQSPDRMYQVPQIPAPLPPHPAHWAVYAEGSVLRIEKPDRPEFWIAVDLDTTSYVQDLHREIARLKASHCP